MNRDVHFYPCAWLTLLFATAVFALPSLYQYLSLQLLWHDAGHVYSMAMHYVQSGEPFSYDLNASHLNYHFFPFLYVIGLLTKVLGGKILAFQMLHVAALITAAMLVYIFANEILRHSILSFCIALSFILSAYTNAINISLHYEVFGVMFLLAFGLFAVQRHRIMASACLILAMTVKEDFWLYGTLTTFCLFRPVRLKDSALYLSLVVAYFVLILGFLYNWLEPNQLNFVSKVWNYGNNWQDIARYLVTHWPKTVPKLFSVHGRDFLFSLGLLVFFAPIRAGFMLSALFIWVNSTTPERNSLSFYYSYSVLTLAYLVLPFAIQNFCWLAEKAITRTKSLWAQTIPRKFIWTIPAVIILFAAIRSQVLIVDGLRNNASLRGVFSYTATEHEAFVRRTLEELLAANDRSILTQFTLASYVPWREDLHIAFKEGENFLRGELLPDYLAFDLSRPSYFLPRPGMRKAMIDRALESGLYRSLVQKDDFYLLEKRQVKANDS